MFEGKPSEFMKMRRPDEFSDSDFVETANLDQALLEFVLDNLTAKKQETTFEHFCRKICEKEICPNLLPQSGPTGGGDSKVDSQTYSVSEQISERWYQGNPAGAKARWGFAFSAQKTWKEKVKRDMASIASTDRSYEKVFFVSNQAIRDKDRAKFEDELSKEHGFRVEILDRAWLVDRILQNGRQEIAIKILEIPLASSKIRQVGPKDYRENLALAELERNLGDTDRYAGVEFQLPEEALEAADLSKSLEKPRFETDGRFMRARDLAKKYGTRKSQLKAIYHHLYANFYWHDDCGPTASAYSEVEHLVDVNESGDLEFLSTLLTILRTATSKGMLGAAEADIPGKWLRLRSQLEALSCDKTRPGNALWAKTIHLIQAIYDRAHTKADLNEVVVGLQAVLAEGESLMDFPLSRTINIIEACESIFEELPGYPELFQQVVEITKRRSGDLEAGHHIFRRAAELYRRKKYYGSLALIGQAQTLFAKEESNAELLKCLGLAGAIYYDVGLYWAARFHFMALCERSLKAFYKDGHLSAGCIHAVSKMFWIEIKLGRVASCIAWQHLQNQISKLQTDFKANPNEYIETLTIQDAVLSILLLKSNLEDLQNIGFLPSYLRGHGNLISETAILFALGQIDEIVPVEFLGKSEEDYSAHFDMLMGQPAAEDVADSPDFGTKPLRSFRSKVLGCDVRFDSDANVSSITLAETMLGVLEGLFATSLDGRAYSHRPSINILIRSTAGGISSPTLTEEASGGDYAFTIDCPDLAPIYLDLEMRYKSREWLLESSWRIFSKFAKVDEYLIKKLMKDEMAQDRSLIFSDLWILSKNIFGDQLPIGIMAFDRDLKLPRFALKRTTPWCAKPKPKPEKSDVQPSTVFEASPDSLSDIHKRRHDKMTVESIIDIELWDKAQWEAVMFMESRPPIIALAYKNLEAGKQIFLGLRRLTGKIDSKNQIRVSVIKGVDSRHPHTYAILIGSELGADGRESDHLITSVSRINRMNAASSANIDRFLQSYRVAGEAMILPGSMKAMAVSPESIEQHGIVIRSIHIRNAWEIGLDDPDTVAIEDGATPVIPAGVDVAPILEKLQKIRERRAKMASRKP